MTERSFCATLFCATMPMGCAATTAFPGGAARNSVGPAATNDIGNFCSRIGLPANGQNIPDHVTNHSSISNDLSFYNQARTGGVDCHVHS